MTYYITPHRHMHNRMAQRMMSYANEFESTRDYQLSLNVQGNDDEFILSALVPGMNAEDLNIQVLENVVTITGEYKENEGEYLMQELPQGTFRRSLRLPTAVNAEKVDAKIVNGILTVKLPKVESAKPRTIKVEAK